MRVQWRLPAEAYLLAVVIMGIALFSGCSKPVNQEVPSQEPRSSPPKTRVIQVPQVIATAEEISAIRARTDLRIDQKFYELFRNSLRLKEMIQNDTKNDGTSRSLSFYKAVLRELIHFELRLETLSTQRKALEEIKESIPKMILALEEAEQSERGYKIASEALQISTSASAFAAGAVAFRQAQHLHSASLVEDLRFVAPKGLDAGRWMSSKKTWLVGAVAATAVFAAAAFATDKFVEITVQEKEELHQQLVEQQASYKEHLAQFNEEYPKEKRNCLVHQLGLTVLLNTLEEMNPKLQGIREELRDTISSELVSSATAESMERSSSPVLEPL